MIGVHVHSLKGQETIFRGFARDLEFDPLVATNWFSPHSLTSLKSHKVRRRGERRKVRKGEWEQLI